MFMNILLKSIANDVRKICIRKTTDETTKSVLMDKLGVRSIDEFMKMDEKEYNLLKDRG